MEDTTIKFPITEEVIRIHGNVYRSLSTERKTDLLTTSSDTSKAAIDTTFIDTSKVIVTDSVKIIDTLKH